MEIYTAVVFDSNTSGPDSENIESGQIRYRDGTTVNSKSADHVTRLIQLIGYLSHHDEHINRHEILKGLKCRRLYSEQIVYWQLQ